MKKALGITKNKATKSNYSQKVRTNYGFATLHERYRNKNKSAHKSKQKTK